MSDGQQRGKSIKQFMWSYQHFFRMSVQNSLKRTLSRIGFDSDPDVLLIGFDATGEKEYSVCIEPENGSFGSLDLTSVPDQGVERYQADPKSKMFYSDTRLHSERHLTLLDRSYGAALAIALQESTPGIGMLFFCQESMRVEGYDVYVAIGLASEELDLVPQLKKTIVDRMSISISPSLVHAVVNDILARSRRALQAPDPGKNFYALDADYHEIARTATIDAIRSTLVASVQERAYGNEHSLSEIASLPYEKRWASGRTVFADIESGWIEISLRLSTPVKLDDINAVRKLMEASGKNASLLSDGYAVYGFGRVIDDYDPESESIFIMSIKERGVWDISHAGKSLFTVTDGVGRLTVSPLNISLLRDTIHRTVPGAETDTLLRLAEAASNNKHGAMLIISANAEEEAHRLSPQVWRVEPTELDSTIVEQLTDIDGGILVDNQGKCHAIGVILDGTADGVGTPARGSRFNNAVRYLNSNPPPAVVVVYSTDGRIDILPVLIPQIERSKVIESLDRYIEIAGRSNPDFEIANRAWDKLMKVQFYLSAEQCDSANLAKSRLEEIRNSTSFIQIDWNPLKPNPEMNDSYFS
jgi:sensor domain DACNG-containing protein/sensor domain DACNH-containing protein/DisA checkpoint controller-like protein